MNTTRRYRDDGFTLIELLIVIVVLGILAGVVIFSLGGVQASATTAACQADGATLQKAIADANTLNAGNVVTSKQTEGTFVGSGKGVQQWPTGSGFSFTLPKGNLDVALGASSPTLYTGPQSCIAPSGPAPTIATTSVPGIISTAVDSHGDLFYSSIFGVGVVAANNTTIFGQSVTSGVPTRLSAASSLLGIRALTLDSAGDLFLGGGSSGNVYVIPVATGTIFGQAVTANVASKVTSASTQQMGNATSMAVDSSGNLFSFNSALNALFVMPSATGTVFGTAVTADQAQSLTAFSGLSAGQITFDSSGNLYATTSSGVEVLPVASTTLFGQSVVANTPVALSSASGAKYPQGLAIDSVGDLVISNWSSASSNVATLDVVPKSSGTFFGQSVNANTVNPLTGLGTFSYALTLDFLPSGHMIVVSPNLYATITP